MYGQGKTLTKRRSLAETFARDERMETVLHLKEFDPDAYAALGANLHLSAGYYLQAKEAAEAEGLA